MNIYIWGFISAFLAASLETFFRYTKVSWISLLPITIIPILFLNYSLFRLLRTSDNIISAFVVFGMCSISLRVLSSVLILKDPVSRGTWAAVAIIIVAQFVKVLK
jgi:hypothetical protein